MNYVDLKNWNRIQHFNHFKSLKDPFFALTVPVDVTVAYKKAKTEKVSFFCSVLACLFESLKCYRKF